MYIAADLVSTRSVIRYQTGNSGDTGGVNDTLLEERSDVDSGR